MPVEVKIIESECKFHAIVTASSIAQESDLRAILVDLDQALDMLKEDVETGDNLVHALCVQVAGVEPETGLFGEEGFGGTYDPWTSFCPAFWTKLVATPSLEKDLSAFLEKLRSVLEHANGTLSYPMSEDDETQFAEPLLAHLALTDPRFIPMYQAFLEQWDMDHEVEISGAVLEILETYPTDMHAIALREYCKNAFEFTDFAEQL